MWQLRDDGSSFEEIRLNVVATEISAHLLRAGYPDPLNPC